MGQKTVRFSDLSGQLIMHDDALARIVVHEHPELVDGPVEIEALTDEAEAIEQAALRVAVVDLYLPDDLEPRRIVMEADAFDKLATENPMDQLLIAARPVRRSPRTPVNGGSRGDRLDYSTLEHAGKPHKGKVTDAEKHLVRDHLDEINQRLAGQGIRTISLADPDHIERYGLQQSVRDRTAELDFDLEVEDSAVEDSAVEDSAVEDRRWRTARSRTARSRPGRGRSDDDQDLDADQPDALRDERERGAGHHEQQGGQGLGGPGREELAAFEYPVQVDGDGDEQQPGQGRGGGDDRAEKRLPGSQVIASHHTHFRRRVAGPTTNVNRPTTACAGASHDRSAR